MLKFKKDAEGKLVLDDEGNPIAIDGEGNPIPLDKVVSLGKHQRIEGERDEYKSKVEELTGQISELQKSAGNAEELKAKVEELTTKSAATETEFQAKIAARDKEYVLDTALLGAGVPADRLKAAKALVDPEKIAVVNGKLDGLDLDTFKKDAAYLFTESTTVSSAAASRGAAGGDADEAQMRSIMGLEPKE